MPQIIIHSAQDCQIESEDNINFLQALDQHLSYKVQGAEYMSSYQFGKWDGLQRLLRSELIFPYGLLERVKSFYNQWNRSFSILDQRPPKEPNLSINILTRLKELNKDPYFYQLNALDVTKQFDCGILKLATGAGKSNLSALITANFGKRTIIYVIGKGLMYQFHKLYSSLFQNHKIGIIGDGLCDIQEINIASIWTVAQVFDLKNNLILDDYDLDKEKSITQDKYDQIKDLMRTAKVHIFDECHMAACKTIQTIASNINPEHIYGMSASPWRDDGADLMIESILGKNLIDISASYLIEHGFLTQPFIKFRAIPKFHEKLPKNYHTIHKRYVVENEVRNKIILEDLLAMVNAGYKPLVLFNIVKHGDLLYSLCKDKLPISLLSGKDDQDVRDKAKDDLESGKIKAILASRIFDIGEDIPCASGLILADGGKSTVRTFQRPGRIIRKYPGKSKAMIRDYYNQAHYLKDHAQYRKKCYLSEPKFNVTICKEMN